MSPTQRLRQLLAEPGLLLMPACYDAISARLVENAGYKLSFMSGFSVAAARLGLPDTGLISFAEMLDQLRNICNATSLPIVADGDTGYGNALNVQRTVADFARAGAACVMIEDQVWPKKCGHTKGKRVVSRAEARMKIRAAVDARTRTEVLIMARTDARAVLGYEAALERCHDFVEEGADIVFLEAPESEDEMRRFCREIKRPTMCNLLLGGKTPVLPPVKLGEMGYKIAVYPLELLSAAIVAMQRSLAELANTGVVAKSALSFEELKTLVGFPRYYEGEAKYRAAE
ncbi:MAG: isocitrate lyase/PEP mutase family protein [Rhodospirillaceae bacterium]|nr:isocitrate lyase/PEP mutase family protein [Rhodospirillaceae bacterium]